MKGGTCSKISHNWSNLFSTGCWRSPHDLYPRHHCCSCPALIVFCLSIVDMDARGDSFSKDELPVRQPGGKPQVNPPLDGRAAA